MLSSVPFLFLLICYRHIYIIIFKQGNEYDIIVHRFEHCFKNIPKMFQKVLVITHGYVIMYLEGI